MPPDEVDEAVVAAARQVIEQAKGAVMLVYSVDADHAFAILRTASQDTNIKLRDIAAAVVEELPEIGAPRDMEALLGSRAVQSHHPPAAPLTTVHGPSEVGSRRRPAQPGPAR